MRGITRPAKRFRPPKANGSAALDQSTLARDDPGGPSACAQGSLGLSFEQDLPVAAPALGVRSPIALTRTANTHAPIILVRRSRDDRRASIGSSFGDRDAGIVRPGPLPLRIESASRTGFISARGLGSPLPRLRRDWAHSLSQLHRGWASLPHLAEPGPTLATSALGTGSPLPHLRRD